MMNSPLVSVIIPTYNRGYIIERAIKSVLSQSYKNFELIVVDDGSTDDTKFRLENYPMKYLHQENRGVSHARNRGLEVANGEYICFLDSDDEWLESKLDKQVRFFIDNPNMKWVHTEEIWIRNGKRVNQMKKHQKSGGDQFIPSLNLCLIGASTVMMQKEVLVEQKGFNKDYIVCEDYDLWLRLLLSYEVGFIEKPLIHKYGGHEDQLSLKYFAMDYWRVRTLSELLGSELSEQRLRAVCEVGARKAKRLIQGYRKHNNLEHLDFIERQLYLFQEHLQRLP